jgi:hypothetical protein
VLEDPGFGHCAVRVQSDHTAIVVACRQVGVLPCMSAALVEADGGRRNPDRFDCYPSYEPASLRFGTDPMDHFQVSLPFKDPSGVANYPVDEARLAGAQVRMSAYHPVDHFTRRLVIPQLHLKEAAIP